VSSNTVVAIRQVEAKEAHGSGTLRDILHVLFKYKGVIVLFFLGTMSTVTIVNSFFTKTEYQATTQLLLSPDREQVANLTLSPGAVQGQRIGVNVEEQTARMMEMIGGHYLAERVVQTIGPVVLYGGIQEPWWSFGLLKEQTDPQELLDRAVERFTQHLVAEPAGKSYLVNLSFRHSDPIMAAKAVNLLAAAYVDRQLGVQKNPKSDAFFQEQFKLFKQKLQESEDKLESFKKSNGITSSVKDEQELILRQQVTLRSALHETLSQRAEAASRIAQIGSQMANTSRIPGVANHLRDKLTALEVQENELALRQTAENPMLRGLREEIGLLREKLSQEEGSKLFGTVSSGGSNLYGQLQQELLRNKTEEQALRARQEAQTAKLAELQRRLDTLDRIGIEFNHLQQQVQMDEQNNRFYIAKFEESRISSAMDAEKIASVRVIEQAEPPRRPVSSKAKLRLVLGLIFGGVGGVAMAFLLHLTSGRLATDDEVERYLELPVLASIPELNVK